MTTVRTNRLLSRWARGVAFSAGLAPLLVVGHAHADLASWMFVGGGMGNADVTRTSASDAPGVESGRETLGTLQLDAGFGSDPARPWVFGGLARTLTFFNAGTDLSLLLRTTTGGFARGDWGVALDVGGYQRWWGPDQTGLQVSLNLGAPWGLQLGVTGAGNADSQSVALTLGLDWARATAHRQSAQSWWPNYVLPLPEHD